MPVAPITSALGVLFDKNKGDRGPLINASGQAQRIGPVRAKPLVIVMVVGETARAANFQLGGYARPTNPELAATGGLIYFPETTSCGTATAISVPCMFSRLPRRDFDVDEAPRYANLLDALQEAGLEVEWRDNDAGCKGVCARVHQISYSADRDAKLCRESYCYDEIMLTDLPAKLASLTRDTVIVMHQIGSHGPAYAERYPPEFERFKPACRSNQLQRCTPQEIVNAYDNTIAYSDHMLARTIEVLRDASSHIDGMLLYASDHGESLGEQGLYLHGLPYAFAPDTQKHVPMLMWLSPTYAARAGVATACLRSQAERPLSHDNIYHTIMGAAEVRNASYDPQLDMLAACRGPAWPSDHE
jgi:lipid A ethanolaminephosphotransferase